MDTRKSFKMLVAITTLLVAVSSGPILAGEILTGHHNISLNYATINGLDMTSSRTIVVLPGEPLFGAIRVTAYNAERSEAVVSVAATPNWKWGGLVSNSQIFTEIDPSMPQGTETYTYLLPFGLTAPETPGTYYIGVFNGSVHASSQLMSCDGFPLSIPPEYFWDSENAGDPAAPDIAHWTSALWEQAVAGDHVEAFQFCNEVSCGTARYGAAAIRVVVPGLIELEPEADSFIGSSTRLIQMGSKKISERYVNFGTNSGLSVIRGSYVGLGGFLDWRGTLIRFDLSDVPQGAEVLSAELFLYHYSVWGELISIHRMTKDWTESGVTWWQPCQGCETWWSGWDDGNYVKEPTDSQRVTDIDTWFSWDVTEDVKLFLQETPNYGWFLKSVQTTGSDLTSASFYSKDNLQKKFIPFLRISFTIPSPDVTFTADPSSILPGGSSTLIWTTAYADDVSIDQGIGTVELSGSIIVSPETTRTYTLTATGQGKTTTRSVTVTVLAPPPSVTMNATPEAIRMGESATLTWSSTDATSASISPDIGDVSVDGSTTVSPTETTTYTITVTGTGGSVAASATVTVTYPLPTVNISASPGTIAAGESSALSWTSAYANTCSIEPEIGDVDPNGSTTVAPTETTTYNISCTGAGGTVSAQTVVSVTGPREPQPEGSFGEQYEDLIPPDAAGSYDPKRFSLITGLVQDINGSSIAGASITLLDHQEYGTVRTNAEGRFSIPVEGGGTLTVVYRKAGLIPSQRKVYVSWNDTAIVETITMIAQDAFSTTFTFDGNPNTVVTHQSTIVTDQFGSRSSTLVFTGDNRAYSVDTSGQVIQELTTVTTRATEFTTEASMPAKLPPNSAYTYCVELGVDSVERVHFEKPVMTWVDNFLGFPVGGAVPVGYYDRDRGVWVPSDNGVVVRLLDTSGDGIIDALDATGDNQPDDLNGDGSFSDEVLGLNDPQRYRPGLTFWRVGVTHFTPYDCNWPFGPPPDAVTPNAEGMPDADQQMTEEEDCTRSTNSFVEERSRIFHEDIPIPGTDTMLHYTSSRVKGYRQKITVPASGPTVPSSLKRIIVQVKAAGRTFERILEPLSNQNVEFEWDSLDFLGREIVDQTNAYVNLGFVYDGFYYVPGGFAQAFGQMGDGPTLISARQEVISWKNTDIKLMAKPRRTIAEGWTISNHHYLNPRSPSVLYKGDGTILRNDSDIIETFASEIYGEKIAIDASGNLYLAGLTINKIDTKGIVTRIAGNGTYGYSGDGGPATEAALGVPRGLAVDDLGNVYIADSGNNRIRKIDTRGIITTVAGVSYAEGNYYTQGYSGDGGPAVEARLRYPQDVAVDAQGNLYIADTVNDVIRKVDPNGIITTVAGKYRGTWGCGLGGDGGPAVEARLAIPSGVAIDADGNLYIADNANHRIRKVDKSGIITTIAGSGPTCIPSGGNGGYGGDGGLATEARLNMPYDIDVDAYGNVYIADAWNSRIRKVDTSGVITTVAGNGAVGYGGDGGPAVESQLYHPYGVAVETSGAIYIADTLWNHRVRKMSSVSRTSSYAITGDVFFAEQNGKGHILNGIGKHEATIDLNTRHALYTFGYDQSNNLISISDRFGNQTTINRDENGVPVSIASPDGVTTTLTIGPDNHLTQITYPDGNYYKFEYTVDGLLTAKTEPEQNRFEKEYNARGRLTDVFDEEGGHWGYSRESLENGDILTRVETAEGNVTSYLDHTDSTGAYSSRITDPSGAVTRFRLSADGLKAEKSLPCGTDLDFRYGVDSRFKFKFVKEMKEKNPSDLERVTLREKTYQDNNSDQIPDRITERVTVNGKNTTFVTNTLQGTNTVTSPVGRSVTAFYDPSTLLTTSLRIPGLHDTTFGYDPRGRLTSVKTNTRETTFTYDPQGNLHTITDPENHTTSYTYDPAGRGTGISRPDDTSMGFRYDKNGNMTVLTNPSTIDHGFGYNRVNLNSSYRTPLSGSYQYHYDRDRRLLWVDFPSTKQILNVYDKDRLLQIQTPEGNIDLTYLCGSKLESVTKEGESVAYGYDGVLITSETLSGTLNQVLSHTYNNDFNPTSFTYAGGTVQYGYDSDGLLTTSGPFTITRNSANGLPETVTDGTLNIARTFSGYGELGSQSFSVNGQSLTSWTLTPDKSGRTISKTETVAGTISNYTYTYDPMGRLLTVTRDDVLIEEYRYNPNGSRSYEMNALKGITGKDYAYSNEDHLLTAGDTTYEYDLDGFLTTKTRGTEVTRYTYSSRGELLRVDLPGGRVIEYVNDPLGRRIAKKVDGIITEKYLWQGMTRLLAVYDESDNLIMRFQYADGRVPVSMTRDGVTYYLTYDQVGSLRLVADPSGNVVKRIDYDSFGSIINDTNPSFNVPFGFAGGLHDRDTGLVRFGFRVYDPKVGRWVAKDPILFAGGDVDLYGYVVNNPVNWVDPLGLDFSSGIAVHGEIINPFTSGGGKIWGLNYQNNQLYTYSGSGIGLDIGVGIESVWAWGSGAWTGEFQSINLGFAWFQGSIFWSPGEGGWFGFTFGLSAGLPGSAAYEVTDYKQKTPNPCP